MYQIYHAGYFVIYMYGHTYSKRMYQPGKVANPARGQLNREKKWIFPSPRSRLKISSRETSSAVPFRVSLPISVLRLNLVLTYGIPPEFRGGVYLLFKTAIRHRFSPEFIGHAIAYRRRSLAESPPAQGQ